MEVVLYYKLFRPQIDFEANVRGFRTQTIQNRAKWFQQWLIRGQHRIRRCRFTPATHRHALEAINHVLRPLPASSVRRGLLGWVGLSSENTARISGCGALEPILSLLAGAERGSELVCRFPESVPSSRAECLLHVRAPSFRSAGLLRCLSAAISELACAPPRWLAESPRSQAPCALPLLPILIVPLQLWRCLVLLCAPEQHQ